ncbi:MAG: amino acid adenylation domain-containing protein [Isosphaeraceae bacterium]
MNISVDIVDRFSSRRSARPIAWVPAQIAAWAESTPDRLAVHDGATRLSFAELDRRANRLAGFLRDAGMGPDRCVGLYLERSADFVVAALGAFKAGAAYLPLDPATPAERVAFILGDAASPVVLTHKGKGRTLPEGSWRVVELDGPDALAIARQPDAFEAVDPGPDALAYVIYTSGSTGQPKGAEITLANLDNLIAWHRDAFEITPEDRVSHVAGLAFDPSVWELWPNLTAGASLHVADDVTRRSPSMLRDWLLSERITVCFAPTLTAELLLDESWPADAPLRVLMTGGEALRRRPRIGLPFRFVNCYGPAECTVVVTSREVPHDATAEAPPTIGWPIPNVTALILDDDRRPVPDGEPGELCFAGQSVGRGYRRNPGLTAERFVTLSREGEDPVRVYRTGDRARRLPSGELEFLGRLDDQVKIRGYRIEPGEIVAVLGGHPGVASSAVVPLGDGIDRSLAAYVVAARGARLTTPELRTFLAAKLPDYMVPAHFVALRSLPTTLNGKLDRSALPVPTPENQYPSSADADASPEPPSDAAEERIAAMVAGLLGQATIGRDDNFFLAGGHSMLGVQLVAKIRDAFGVKITLRQLFNAPTVAALAGEVARLDAVDKPR